MIKNEDGVKKALKHLIRDAKLNILKIGPGGRDQFLNEIGDVSSGMFAGSVLLQAIGELYFDLRAKTEPRTVGFLPKRVRGGK